jgi:hypothetical protein
MQVIMEETVNVQTVVQYWEAASRYRVPPGPPGPGTAAWPPPPCARTGSPSTSSPTCRTTPPGASSRRPPPRVQAAGGAARPHGRPRGLAPPLRHADRVLCVRAAPAVGVPAAAPGLGRRAAGGGAPEPQLLPGPAGRRTGLPPQIRFPQRSNTICLLPRSGATSWSRRTAPATCPSSATSGCRTSSTTTWTWPCSSRTGAVGSLGQTD